MITQGKLDEWKRMAQWEDCCVNATDSFNVYDIREMLTEIERLRKLEEIAKETGVFQ